MSTPTSEFFQRLIALGYPESVARRIASGELPMDYASRMQRAKDLGYDVNNVEYRGGGLTQIESPNRLFDNGFYSSQNPYLANTYSMKQGGNVMPVLINKDNYMQVEGGGRFWDQIQAGDSPDLQDAFDALGYNASHGLRGEITTDQVLDIADDAGRRGVSFNQVKDMGPYSRKLGKEMIYKGGEPSNNTASLNQRNVRSALSAAFDPEYVGPNILGNADPKLLAGLAGGSLLGAVAPKVKSEETKEVDPFVQALMDYTSDANFLPSPPERLIPMSEIPAEMKANNPDLIRDITNWAGNAMGGDYYDYRAAEGLMNVADFLPYIGGGISLQQGADAYRNNRKWEGRLLTGLGLLEVIPYLGKMASESIAPAVRPTMKKWDESDSLLRLLEQQ